MSNPYEPAVSPPAAVSEPPAPTPAAAPEPKPEPTYAQFAAARGGNEKAAEALPQHSDLIPTDAPPWIAELFLKILHKL